MGSKITRALSRTERNSRRTYNSREVHQIIQFMSLSMSSLTIFSEGFITNQNQQHLHTYVILSSLSAFAFNRINPTIYLLISCLFFLFSAFIFTSFHILYAFVTILFMNGFASLAYNYHNSSEISLIKCSIIFYTYFCIQRISDQCSFNLQLIRIQQSPTSPTSIDSMHNLTIRLLFFILGLLSCLLVVGSNAYIRRWRFIPMTINEQLKQISSIQFFRCLIFSIIYGFFQNVMTTQFWIQSGSSFGVDALTIYQKLVVIMILIPITSFGYQMINRRCGQNAVSTYRGLAFLFYLLIGCLSILGVHQKSSSLLITALDIMCLCFMMLLQILTMFLATSSFSNNRMINLGVISIILMNKLGKGIGLESNIKILLWIISGGAILASCLQRNQGLSTFFKSKFSRKLAQNIDNSIHEENQLINSIQ